MEEFNIEAASSQRNRKDFGLGPDDVLAACLCTTRIPRLGLKDSRLSSLKKGERLGVKYLVNAKNSRKDVVLDIYGLAPNLIIRRVKWLYSPPLRHENKARLSFFIFESLRLSFGGLILLPGIKEGRVFATVAQKASFRCLQPTKMEAIRSANLQLVQVPQKENKLRPAQSVAFHTRLLCFCCKPPTSDSAAGGAAQEHRLNPPIGARARTHARHGVSNVGHGCPRCFGIWAGTGFGP